MPSSPSLAPVAPASKDDDSSLSSLRMPSMTTLRSSQSAYSMTRSEMESTTPRALSPEQKAYREYEADLDNALDTALSKRVASIQVPDNVAESFRLSTSNISPDRRPASSGGYGDAYHQKPPRRTLTLKEQNAKTDALTKENFDLKLKIHYLSEALHKHSEEGVDELIATNVQLQTDLANERKDASALRKKLREYETRFREIGEELAEARQNTTTTASRDDDDNPTLQAQMHEEILYLHQKNDRLEETVTTLREEVMSKEQEKRKMAEHMRGMAGKRGEETTGLREMEEMWQDLLNAETGRREQAEEEIAKLRNELTALRLEKASPAPTRVADKLKAPRRRSRMDELNSVTSDIEDDIANGVRVAIDDPVLTDLRRELELQKHEAEELRRNLAAQTSMLTSRNREREMLQTQVEDLKLMTRKSDGGARSLAGESIFDRSVSRAHQHHQRAHSRLSDHTAVTEAEREEWHKKEGELRDVNAEHRLKYQELERKHNTYLNYVDILEQDYQQMEEELNSFQDDVVTISKERDELLKLNQEQEAEIATIREEALDEIAGLEQERDKLNGKLEDLRDKLDRTSMRLQTTVDGYKGLQGELRDLTARVIDLEDVKAINERTIANLEKQMTEAEEEITKWDQKCSELDQKNRKLEIAEESLHSEITFLRQEQEGDKIKIGELEGALNAAHQTIQDEQEKSREMEETMEEERRQRDVLENQSKEEVQKVLDELNSDNTKTKDEVRRLRRALSAKEVEATSEKQKLDQLEQSLRSVLGDPRGTKQSLLADIEKLQRDLDTTASELDRAKMDLSDKERLLRHRDGLLESTSLESRRLSDLLEKERNGRKHDLEQFEKSSRGQASHMRAIAQHESRYLELETVLTQERRSKTALEQKYRDQSYEMCNLLLAVWNRLSTICGADWAQNNSLINGEIPSIDTIGQNLPAFNKNLINAIKTLEALFGSFKSRIRSIEKDLWRDYQTLEHNLEMRARRMDNLEHAVIETQQRIEEEARAQAAQQQQQRPETQRSSSGKILKGSDEISKLKSEIKLLKTELKFHRQHPSALAQQMLNQQAQMNPELMRAGSSSGSTKNGQSPARQVMAHLLRHHSTSAVEQLQYHEENGSPTRSPQQIVVSQQPMEPSEARWLHRLKELERRLKAEREARLLDRQGARRRLEEERVENESLRAELERERQRYEVEGAEEGDAEE
ncbi:Anucleate primary sterigmata protein B [Pseudocercospora fuligena]|uniref:Anucleate primary sterigmata protein B n=1 Tax=Pseudocercospora fuligena TaxID=685502 RepID=A0A8H6RTN7_9PEZI|nr:Anucleate primary sterigmata protein B [Pseudocercospora fuligena]